MVVVAFITTGYYKKFWLFGTIETLRLEMERLAKENRELDEGHEGCRRGLDDLAAKLAARDDELVGLRKEIEALKFYASYTKAASAAILSRQLSLLSAE